MFCPKCGNQMPNDSRFCSQCGSAVNPQPTSQQPPFPEETPFFQQAPDTGGSARSAAGSLGTILMMGSVVFDLISMVAIGSDAFIPITIAAGVIFGIGFLLRMTSI